MVAHLVELHIELCRLTQGHVDFLDFADLAADVVVDEFEAVLHVVFLKEVEGFEQFGRGEAELAAVATRFLPFACARAGQLDAHAEVGRDLQATGDFCCRLQFVQLLADDDDLTAHLLGEQGELDELLVLVTIANDERVGVGAEGDDGVKLGLGAGFQTDVALLAVADDLFDHGAHLVHLDGHHHEVLALEFVFLGSFLKTRVDFVDAVVEDVGETYQHRCRDISQ